MINAIPFIGWGLSFFFAISMAVPFWIVWTVCGIGRDYFYFLPDVWQNPGFWATVGIFIAVSIIKSVFVPTLSSNTNTNTKSD